jgi:Methyltransferase domain
MLRFVDKHLLWSIADTGVASKCPPHPAGWHLKSIQDVVAFSYLHGCRDMTIGEIGGGTSRLLPVLAKTNRCFNIEKFEGLGKGPTREHVIPGVETISAYVGSSRDVIEDGLFDIIFSISVVEHVKDELLPDFYSDCRRILKQNGLMLHLIDVYIDDDRQGAWHRRTQSRIAHYRQPFADALFRSPQEDGFLLDPEDLRFSCSYATNPDSFMERWNRSVPQLRPRREVSQCCSLLQVGHAQGG